MTDEDGDCLFTTGGCCLVLIGTLMILTSTSYAIFKILVA